MNINKSWNVSSDNMRASSPGWAPLSTPLSYVHTV